MSERKSKLTRKEILAALWKRGDLEYKLNPAQEKMHKVFETDDRKIVPILASRRTGKTFYLVLLSVMKCIKKEFATIKFLCPTQKQVKTNIRPIMREILKDCPELLKPEWKEADKMYIFPNGSEIQLAGADNKAYESLRGGAADICIVDEAGFCSDLYDAVFSVLQPTTATTAGQIFLASTPSKLATHDFIQVFVNPAKNAGLLPVFTMNDNTMISEEEKKRIIDSYPGGEESDEYQREYLCKIINDATSVVVPEFTEAIQKEIIKDLGEYPPFYDPYVAADVGFRDLTAVLFCYYDYMGARLVITDELIMNGTSMTTETLASEIKAKEKENFKDDIDGEAKEPYLRIMDNNNLILVNDLTRLHGLNFLATAKDNKEAQINQVRMMIQNKQIIISPKCRHLIYHLSSATWDKNHKNFARLPDLAGTDIRGGHADALDALIYLVRNLVKSHNPYPANWGSGLGTNTFAGPRAKKEDPFEGWMNKVMNIKVNR